MSCWPAIIVGAISLGVLIFDLIEEQWMDLVYHGGIGVGFTLFFWALCFFLGSEISFGVFIVPAVIFLTFLLSSWLFTKNLRDRGCCVKCTGQKSGENSKPTNPPNPPTTPDLCPPALSATPL